MEVSCPQQMGHALRWDLGLHNAKQLSLAFVRLVSLAPLCTTSNRYRDGTSHTSIVG